MEHNQIEFSAVGEVMLGALLGEGSYRDAYECDYIDSAGRTYVVKQATSRHGKTHNAAEHYIYQHAPDAAKFQYPVFLDVTDNGEWLLVEQCNIALDVHIDEYCDEGEAEAELTDIGYELFEGMSISDMHAENWGYTVLGKRPVITDIACADFRFLHICESLGIPTGPLERILSNA